MPPVKPSRVVGRPHTEPMAIEVERKFISVGPPGADQLGRGLPIRQGYLAEDNGLTLRVRISEAGSWLTVKAGDGLARTEVEVVIDADEAEALWPHTAGRRIEKTRYRVPLDGDAGLVAEVDLFEGALAGLCVVEVEFDSVETANAFVPPAWFGRDVTSEPGWSNAALARDGRPPSS